jgi:EAL domain-containing protein (putative c-di-GMP-specific phosphodiesterase class I)
MAHASHFADLTIKGIAQEVAPALNNARLRGGPSLSLATINENLKAWWKALEKGAGLAKLPYSRLKDIQNDFLRKANANAAFSDDLVDAALMQAFFDAFKKGKGLPPERAEAIYSIPDGPNRDGVILSVERLSGADVVPFLRGRVFAALGKAGLSAKADLLTLAALIDELLADPPTETLIHNINIEPLSLLNATFCDDMEAEIKRLPRAAAKRLCLEITERGRDKITIEKLKQLAKLRTNTGVLLSYDDYSGLAHEDLHLALLQPDSVKVDGVIIKRLLVEQLKDGETRDHSHAELTQLMQRIVRNAPDTRLVAEWTETEASYKAAAILGFDAVQSNILLKPKKAA